jgi:hypothetical protein
MTDYNSQAPGGVPCDEQGFLDEHMQANFPECRDPIGNLLASSALASAIFSALCLVIYALRRNGQRRRRPSLSVVGGEPREPQVFDRQGEQDGD